MGAIGFEASSEIATAALVFILLPPSLFVFCLSCGYGRGRIDWARQCYKFFLPAFGLFNLFCILDIVTFCTMAIESVISNTDDINNMGHSFMDSRGPYDLGLVYSYTHVLTHFLDCVVEILVFLSLSFLSIGLIVARGGFPGWPDRIAKYASYAMATVLGALASASVGLFLWNQVQGGENYLRNDCDDWNDDYYCRMNHYTQAYLPAITANYAFVIITWVCSLATGARSTILLVQAKERHIQMASRWLLSCSVLWFVRTTFNFGMEVKNQMRDKWRHGHGSETILNIVNVFMSIWTMFAILAILHFLGTNRRNGLFLSAKKTPNSLKNLQVNQLDKSFQNIEIPLHPEHTPSGLSSRGQGDSPSSTQSPAMTAPPPSFAAAQTERLAPINQAPAQARGLADWPPRRRPVAESVYGLVRQPQDQDWVRPPSVDPPPQFPVQTPPRVASPPTHEELMGYNHQADGYTPSAALPYSEKQ